MAAKRYWAFTVAEVRTLAIGAATCGKNEIQTALVDFRDRRVRRSCSVRLCVESGPSVTSGHVSEAGRIISGGR